jgi:prepilin-type N-terminal cleavage/methylation domain-containing protein
VRSARQAFTLFEVMLVLAVLVLLAAVVVPSLDSWLTSFRVTAAGDAVRAAWAQARSHAINDGTSYRFCLIPNTGIYRLAPDSATFWGSASGSDGSSVALAQSHNPPLVLEETLPRGVRFVIGNGPSPSDNEQAPAPGAVDTGVWSNPVVFYPDGTARDDVDLILRGRRGRALLVRLRGLTGAVTSRWLPEGGRPGP